MKPGDLVIILHEKDKLTSRYGSLGIVLSARNLGGTDDLGFQLNNLRHEAVRFEGSLAFIGFTL